MLKTDREYERVEISAALQRSRECVERQILGEGLRLSWLGVRDIFEPDSVQDAAHVPHNLAAAPAAEMMKSFVLSK